MERQSLVFLSGDLGPWLITHRFFIITTALHQRCVVVAKRMRSQTRCSLSEIEAERIVSHGTSLKIAVV